MPRALFVLIPSPVVVGSCCHKTAVYVSFVAEQTLDWHNDPALLIAACSTV
jgi:hypothetical protein